MAWNDIQLHVSPAVGALIPRVAPVENRQFHKPKYGFWTSTYANGSSAWVDWCMAEEFGDVLAGRWFTLLPDRTARVFTIDGLPDLQQLCTRYPEPGGEMFMRFFACLDFERIAQEYDGLHLTDAGQWATRHTTPGLNGWDCESTLWFRWKFLSFEEMKAPQLV